jgi:hypothetical protein
MSKKRRKRNPNSRFHTDVQYRTSQLIRSHIRQAIKARRTVRYFSKPEFIGCTIKELRVRIAAQFRDGMTWKNWGKVWHLDHVQPLCSYDLSSKEQQMKACHYTNLQPLLIEENLKKGGKYDASPKSVLLPI